MVRAHHLEPGAQCHLSSHRWSEVERVGAQLVQLGRSDDPLVRDALQAAAKQAHGALTGAPAVTSGGAEIVSLRPRQSGQ